MTLPFGRQAIEKIKSDLITFLSIKTVEINEALDVFDGDLSLSFGIKLTEEDQGRLKIENKLSFTKEKVTVKNESRVNEAQMELNFSSRPEKDNEENEDTHDPETGKPRE